MSLKGFVVLVDEALTLDEMLALAGQVSAVAGVRALHPLKYVTPEAYSLAEPVGDGWEAGEGPPWRGSRKFASLT